MGHIDLKNYLKLQKRLNDSPQGLTMTEGMYKILKEFFSEREAGLVSVLPMNFFTTEQAAKLWKLENKKATPILDELANKGILLDFAYDKSKKAYIIAPTMAGFFEFALMRTDGKFDHKIMSELFYKYINNEDDYIRKIFLINPAVERTLVHEEVIQPKDKTEVLDYERATTVIKSASCITLSNCYCRHKKQHLGKACDNPQQTCLTLNKAAESFVKHKIAPKISVKKALSILDECKKLGLVQLGDNIQTEMSWICNCCSCCCDGLNTYRRLGYNPKIESNFIASSSRTNKCIGCDICVKRCPVEAIKMIKKAGKFQIKINKHRCIGCGVCAQFCPSNNRTMSRRKKLNFTPVDTFERYILSAIDKGQLQNLLFDNYTLWTHDILRRFLGIIFNLSPAKQLLASRQLQSLFLKTIVSTKKYHLFDKIYNKGKKINYSHPELK